MTLKEKLADWLSGGEITRLREQAERNITTVAKALKAHDDLRNAVNEIEAIREDDLARAKATEQRYQLARVTHMEVEAQNRSLKERLAMIAGLETANANATVRKMARIARGDMPVEVAP